MREFILSLPCEHARKLSASQEVSLHQTLDLLASVSVFGTAVSSSLWYSYNILNWLRQEMRQVSHTYWRAKINPQVKLLSKRLKHFGGSGQKEGCVPREIWGQGRQEGLALFRKPPTGQLRNPVEVSRPKLMCSSIMGVESQHLCTKASLSTGVLSGLVWDLFP